MKLKSRGIVLLLIFSFILTACGNRQYNNLLEDEGLKQSLRIELIDHPSKGLLQQKLMKFAEKHADVEINIVNHPYGGTNMMASWLLEGRGEPPDILELTPDMLKLLFHHGKIEALSIQEPDYQDYLIHSPEGYVLGVISKMNPLVLYYNREIFRRNGLEIPTEEWDWAQFEQTISVLKDRGEKVYILPTPYHLEWVTMNRFGGRIADTTGMVFEGYLDSDAAVQAAEWFAWINSRNEDYRLRQVHGHDTYWPFPYDLIEDNMALAAAYAYYIEDTGITYYGAMIERNHEISIAPLPGGKDAVNPTQISGLAIHSQSKNKGIAMSLLRYLLEDSDDFYRDTVVQTHDGGARGGQLDESSEEWSVVMQEVKKAVPVTLLMNEGQQRENETYRMYKLYQATKSEQTSREMLKGILTNYAEEFDQQFAELRKDPNYLYTCLRQEIGICGQM